MKEAIASEPRPLLYRRLFGLWLAASIVWCGFIGVLAYSEWQAYQRAAHNLDLTLTLKSQLPDPPPPGFYMIEKTLITRDSLQHSQTLLWFFAVIAVVPPGAILLFGLWGRRVGAF